MYVHMFTGAFVPQYTGLQHDMTRAMLIAGYNSIPRLVYLLLF
jgi:hypothetical protein